jgi:pimeloyl-ACP methyl ester carboxylesterase
MLYEPLDASRLHSGTVELAELDRRALSDRPDDLVALFFTTFARVPAPALSRLRCTPEWTWALACVDTLAREARAHLEEPLELEPLRGLDLPVRLLVGSESIDGYLDTARRLDAVLRRAELRTLQGQGHVAHQRAPALIVDELVSFAEALGGDIGCPST